MRMSDHIAAQETINEACACIWNAVKIDPGTRALEGDVESAYSRLDEAREALKLDDIASAQSAVSEALELLRTEESRLIVEDIGALEDAIRLIARLRLT
jgi:hypothetical protein